MGLRSFYDRLVQSSQPPAFRNAPRPVQRSRLNLNAFEGSAFKDRLLAPLREGAYALVLGDIYGLDYFPLRAAGCRACVMDVAVQRGIPDLVLGDANAPLPFRDNAFDIAIAGEILEHVVEDAACLRELRRVLKPDGKLLVTVPFHQDRYSLHIRIHSPASIRRLLEATGFSVVRLVERGGFINLERIPVYVWLKHGVNAFLFLATGGTRYDVWNRLLARVDWWLGTRVPFVLRHTAYWGGYVLAAKGGRRDYSMLNREAFRLSGYQESACRR